MKPRNRAAALIAAVGILSAGCASTRSAPTRAVTDRSANAMRAGVSMEPGSIMADGSTMGAVPPHPATKSPAINRSAAGAPSAAEKMVCAAETRADIAKVLQLKAAPTARSTWTDRLYTCTYRLPMGTFVISVKQSADHAAAKRYFLNLRRTTGVTKTLAGLGQASYGTSAGKVVLIKDNDTLTVDATALPPAFGAELSKRSDFAYEIAADILGCWTGG